MAKQQAPRRAQPAPARSNAAPAATGGGSGARSRVLLFGLVGVAVLALIVAIVVSATGGDDTDGVAQSQPVAVGGSPLPELPASGPDPAVGMKAPTLNGARFDGTPLEVRNDGRGKVVMFLAHWCPHCRAEVPVITDWLAGGAPQGVDLYAVSTGVNASAPNYPPSAWLKDFPVATMADNTANTAAAAFGVAGYPFFVVVEPDGTVAARTSGRLTVPELEALVALARG